MAASYSSSSISISTNSPPVKGSMTVEPRSGYALNTSFYVLTYGWVDDDLPMTYSMSYYSIRITQQFVIKEMDQLPYVWSFLGPGYITCVSAAADALQGTSNTSYPVDVKREVLLSEESLANLFTDAITKQDSFAVLQMVNSASGILNEVNCSAGEYSTICEEAAQAHYMEEAIAVGGSCQSNVSCQSRRCENHKCLDSIRTCPDNCSGQGNCIAIDYNGQPIAQCLSTDFYCKVTCACLPGYYGYKCSLSKESFLNRQRLRENLCIYLQAIKDAQDMSPTVLSSRMASVSAILSSDVEVISAAALNCTLYAIESIAQSATSGFTCDRHSFIAVADSYSAMLQLRQRLPDLQLSVLQNSLSSYAVSCQSIQTPGDVPITIQTASYRMAVDQSSGNMPYPDLLLPSLSEATAHVELNQSDYRYVSVIRMSFVDYSYNVDQLESNSSILAILAGYQYSHSNSNRRYLQEQNFEVGYTVTLVNYRREIYSSFQHSNVSVRCGEYSSLPYYVDNPCFANGSQKLLCPAKYKGTWRLTCPSRISYPRCQFLDGSGRTGFCRLVSYSALYTTCYCTAPLDHQSQRFQNRTISGQQKIFSSTIADLSPGYEEFQWDPVVPVELAKAQGVLLFIGSLIVLAVVGSLLSPLILHSRSQKHIYDVHYSGAVKKRSIDSFYSKLLPDSVTWSPAHFESSNSTSKDWRFTLTYWQLFLRKFSEDHLHYMLVRVPWLEFRGVVVLWLCICGHALTVCWATTLLTIGPMLSISDDRTCALRKTQQSCNHIDSYPFGLKVCTWIVVASRTGLGYCTSSGWPSEDGVLIIGVVILLIFAVGFRLFFQEFQRTLKYLPISRTRDQSWEREFFSELDCTAFPEGDEFLTLESKRSRILRMARINKSNENMISVTLSEEVRFLQRQLSKRSYIFQEWQVGQVNQSIYEWMFVGADQQYLRHAVSLARLQMQTLRRRIDMEAMNTNGDALESYLMKSFLVDMMPIVYQPFGRRFQFCSSGLSAIISETLNRNSNVYQPSLIGGQHTCQYKMLGSISVFLIYVGSMIFLCIYWAMALTENAQNLFFILFLSVTLTDMFFVQPIRIFIHWIGVWKFCISPQLVRKLEHVRKRSKLLLSRSFGVVRDANRAIQHLNPACRISREFADLPIARLLLSIADDDVEFYRKDAPELHKYFARSSRYGYLGFLVRLIDVSYEYLLDLAAVVVTSILVWLGYLFVRYSLVIAAVCLGIVLCLVIASISYAIRKNHSKTGNLAEVEAFTDIRIVYPDNSVALEGGGGDEGGVGEEGEEGDSKMDSVIFDSEIKLKPLDNKSTSPLKRLKQIAHSPRSGGNLDHLLILGRPIGSVDMHRSGRRLQSTRKISHSPREEGPGALSEDMATNHAGPGLLLDLEVSPSAMYSIFDEYESPMRQDQLHHHPRFHSPNTD